MRFSFLYTISILFTLFSFNIASPARTTYRVDPPRRFYTTEGQAYLHGPENPQYLSPHNNALAQGTPEYQAAHQSARYHDQQAQYFKQTAAASGRIALDMARNNRITQVQHATIAQYANHAAMNIQNEAWHRQNAATQHRLVGNSNNGHEHSAVKSGHDAVAWSNMAVHHQNLANTPQQ